MMNEYNAALNLPINTEQIQTLLPHRYPFLLVDRVIAIQADSRITTLKNVTINEPFFNGHFPHRPIMPGVLIIEALAQSAGLLCLLSNQMQGRHNQSLFYLLKVDNARFSVPVVPGDQLHMEVHLTRMMHNTGLFAARAWVDNREVSSCKLMCAARDES